MIVFGNEGTYFMVFSSLFKRHTALSLLLITAFCLTLFGSTSSKASATGVSSTTTNSTNWSMFGGDAQHTNFNAHETLINPANVARLVPKWKVAPVGASQESFPIVVDGVVYTTSNSFLNAYSTRTGVLLWSSMVGTFPTAPAVVGGIVYIGAFGTFNAFNAKTGAKLWTKAIQSGAGITYCGPTVANGMVYETWDNGRTYAFDAFSGKMLWTFVTGGGSCAPAVSQGVLYVNASSMLFALNAKTGAKLWSYVFSSIITTAATVVNNRV